MRSSYVDDLQLSIVTGKSDCVGKISTKTEWLIPLARNICLIADVFRFEPITLAFDA